MSNFQNGNNLEEFSFRDLYEELLYLVFDGAAARKIADVLAELRKRYPSAWVGRGLQTAKFEKEQLAQTLINVCEVIMRNSLSVEVCQDFGFLAKKLQEDGFLEKAWGRDLTERWEKIRASVEAPELKRALKELIDWIGIGEKVMVCCLGYNLKTDELPPLVKVETGGIDLYKTDPSLYAKLNQCHLPSSKDLNQIYRGSE